MKYLVDFTITVRRVVEVEADNEDAARNAAQFGAGILQSEQDQLSTFDGYDVSVVE